ncbi:hypothetical protein H0H87_001699 [Tephrocybe sp. NHM501043]|nr:hypothetical protein H0H87_001699 [Tephrocybe sp. NHM501043]
MTPLFKTFTMPDTVFHKFFFPSIQPVTVVKRIIAVLDEQDSQHISVPFYTNICPYLRHLPSFIRDLAQWAANANYAMDHFQNISGRRADEVKKD